MAQKYTWCNNTEGEACISRPLYRFLANSLWDQKNLNASIYHGTIAYSNHLPIWLELEDSCRHRERKRLFHFETMWIGEVDC